MWYCRKWPKAHFYLFIYFYQKIAFLLVKYLDFQFIHESTWRYCAVQKGTDIKSQWPLPFMSKFSSVHCWVQVDHCIKTEEIPSRFSWNFMFIKTGLVDGQTTWKHSASGRVCCCCWAMKGMMKQNERCLFCLRLCFFPHILAPYQNLPT